MVHTGLLFPCKQDPFCAKIITEAHFPSKAIIYASTKKIMRVVLEETRAPIFQHPDSAEGNHISLEIPRQGIQPLRSLPVAFQKWYSEVYRD